MNPNIILIGGESGAGKSASLRNIPEPEGVMFLNAEANKSLPFKGGKKFWAITITDPYQIHEAFLAAEEDETVHTIVLDTITMTMDMFETIYVNGAHDTQKQWGEYHQFFLKLMNDYAAKSTKRIIVLAHVDPVLNEEKGITETKVQVKGALKTRGVEAYFNTIVFAKCMPTKKLAKYQNDLLKITEREEIDGFKYVFQTQKTKETTGDRIRAPMEMWEPSETYIDNDVELVFTRIAELQESD